MNNMEKWSKVCKITAGICLIVSLLVALLPCFAFKEEVLTDVCMQYGSADLGTWDETDLSSLFADTIISEVTDGLNGGLIGNMARSSVVILFGAMVLTYSSNMYLAMTYFILLLFGIPILSILAAIFQVWGKTKNKRLLSCIFMGINLLFCISIFIMIPGLCISIINGLGMEIGTIYLQMIRTLVFQLMIRCMSVGYWGFIVLQVIALGCGIFRLLSESDVSESTFTSGNKQNGGKLIGISGVYAGAEIAVDMRGIVLGRDASDAELIIESPKVSRKHCKISYDAQKNEYVVTDYSTNGTYAGKRRLTKGVAERFSSGAVLDIGDSKNSFRLS